MRVYLVRQGPHIDSAWLDEQQATEKADTINAVRKNRPFFGGGGGRKDPAAYVQALRVTDAKEQTDDPTD